MSESLPSDIFWRELQFIELDCGRQQGWNPIFSFAITIYSLFDNKVGQYRPFAVPIVKIHDPFNEVTFHSNQPHQESFEPRPLQKLGF
jgi:hypothetical protein